jgi:four helix bundle protein
MSNPDFRRFLFHSLGSTNELEYDFLLARDLGFVPAPLYAERTDQVQEVRRMLVGLIDRVETSPRTGN